MFTLPHKQATRTPPDFSQMLILCSLALLVGLAIPVHGSFVILAQLVRDTLQTGTVHLPRLAIPVVAAVVTVSSFAAFRSRRRVWGLPVFVGSIYLFAVTNTYLRERAWSVDDTPRPGAAILFASCAFLTVISLLYVAWPGKRPPQVFWWRPEPRANRLIRIAAVLFGGGILCTQNGAPLIGYALVLGGIALSYYAHTH